MIDKALVAETVEQALAGTDMFLVDVSVSKDNRVVVEVDSMNYMDVDACAELSRKIEAALDRDSEDFELEVGSAGLTSPLKVRKQFDKNIGNEVEVLTRDGRKFSGTLVETTDDGFTVEVARKVKKEGAKRPVIEHQPEVLAYGDAKSVKYVINFK
ncbi:MAG: ribosome assembly cofactor RimP [Bacteroides sp.]|nr:ribosome assembly cofactor RimP [Bacteroides sp.]MCM1380237.1 ribosome assembly cofactor RimP [Bacteroides sp.]MCM1446545.1 ribosome assembly cofactor RimP [Prevotella sp.]